MLTNATAKAAAPGARAYKITDSGGLYLYVSTTGLRSWRMKYRFAGKEKLLTFGTFPDVSIAVARDCRDEARRELRQHRDPSEARRRARASGATATGADSFETVARRWHSHQLPRWTPVHAGDVLLSLERDAFPAIGAMALSAIDAPAVLRMLRAVEARGSIETARRLRQRASAVFAFAMSEGAAVADPAAIVGKALAPARGRRRQPALVDLDDARALLAAAEGEDASPITKLASRYLALTAVRLAVVRGAEWGEFEDVDWTGHFVGPLRPTWRVPAGRMKLTAMKKGDDRHAHLVPLSAEAVEILRAARSLAGGSRFVFHGRDPRRMLSETAIGQLYARAGYAGRHVPHGWRATFSTILNERFPVDRGAIDQALAHAAKDKVEAYNRAQRLARRRWLFAVWGEMLLNGAVPATALI